MPPAPHADVRRLPPLPLALCSSSQTQWQGAEVSASTYQPPKASFTHPWLGSCQSGFPWEWQLP